MMRACAHSSSAVQIVAITMITPWRHLLRLTWMMIIADHRCLWSSKLIRIIGADSFVVGIFGLHSFISWIGAVAWTPLESSHISNLACQRVKKDTRGTDQVYKPASKRTLHRFCIISIGPPSPPSLGQVCPWCCKPERLHSNGSLSLLLLFFSWRPRGRCCQNQEGQVYWGVDTWSKGGPVPIFISSLSLWPNFGVCLYLWNKVDK